MLPGTTLLYNKQRRNEDFMIYTNVCKHQDSDKLDDIVQYLRLYPNSNALQISEELGIHPYVIIKYMEEGWLGEAYGEFSQLPDN